MGIKVELDKDLEREFRELAMKKFGYSKGSIKKATETAIRQWISEHGTRTILAACGKKETESAVDLLVGLLKNTSHNTSVEEQHSMGKLWARVAEEREKRAVRS